MSPAAAESIDTHDEADVQEVVREVAVFGLPELIFRQSEMHKLLDLLLRTAYKSLEILFRNQSKTENIESKSYTRDTVLCDFDCKFGHLIAAS